MEEEQLFVFVLFEEFVSDGWIKQKVQYVTRKFAFTRSGQKYIRVPVSFDPKNVSHVWLVSVHFTDSRQQDYAGLSRFVGVFETLEKASVFKNDLQEKGGFQEIKQSDSEKLVSVGLTDFNLIEEQRKY